MKERVTYCASAMLLLCCVQVCGILLRNARCARVLFCAVLRGCVRGLRGIVWCVRYHFACLGEEKSKEAAPLLLYNVIISFIYNSLTLVHQYDIQVLESMYTGIKLCIFWFISQTSSHTSLNLSQYSANNCLHIT